MQSVAIFVKYEYNIIKEKKYKGDIMKTKNIFAILIICAIFFLLGVLCSNCINKDNYSKNFAEYSEYQNIKIHVDDDYNQDNLTLYLENLTTISQKLTRNCENIYFTNENLNEKFELDISTKIVAISYGKDIYVNTNYYSDDVLIHEMFHVYDYCNDWISSTNSFKKLYDDYKDVITVSPGNNENSHEFFAAYGEQFTLNKNNLEKNSLYDFFSNLDVQP